MIKAIDDSTIQISELGTDLDIPLDLFELQIKVFTGLKYNVDYDNAETLDSDEWNNLKRKICKRGG